MIFGNKLVKELMRYYLPHNAAAQAEIETAEAGVFDELSEISDGLKELYDVLISEGIVRYETDPFFLSVNLDKTSFAKVLNVLNDNLGMGVTLNGFEILKIEINSAGYENVAYLKLKIAAYIVEIRLDGSKEDRFVATVYYKNRTHSRTLVIDTNYAGDAVTTVTYEVKNADGESERKTEFTLMNLHGAWSYATTERANALLDEIKASEATGDIFSADGTGAATKLVERVLGYLASEKIYPYALQVGRFLIATIL